MTRVRLALVAGVLLLTAGSSAAQSRRPPCSGDPFGPVGVHCIDQGHDRFWRGGIDVRWRFHDLFPLDDRGRWGDRDRFGRNGRRDTSFWIGPYAQCSACHLTPSYGEGRRTDSWRHDGPVRGGRYGR